jgi:hypothetical protein
MRSPSPNAADPISDLWVGRDAFHPSLPSHSSQVTLPDNHLDTLTGDVIPAVLVALLLGRLELVDVLSQDRHGCRPLLVGRRDTASLTRLVGHRDAFHRLSTGSS